MGVYRKKPVEVEAELLTESNADAVAAWSGADRLVFGQLVIPTLEGLVVAKIGDWVIRGVEGEFYPCKASIFDATYDLVKP